jgi:hypothetical protein
MTSLASPHTAHQQAVVAIAMGFIRESVDEEAPNVRSEYLKCITAVDFPAETVRRIFSRRHWPH